MISYDFGSQKVEWLSVKTNLQGSIDVSIPILNPTITSHDLSLFTEGLNQILSYFDIWTSYERQALNLQTLPKPFLHLCETKPILILEDLVLTATMNRFILAGVWRD